MSDKYDNCKNTKLSDCAGRENCHGAKDSIVTDTLESIGCAGSTKAHADTFLDGQDERSRDNLLNLDKFSSLV
jgi:hypothetical protein